MKKLTLDYKATIRRVSVLAAMLVAGGAAAQEDTLQVLLDVAAGRDPGAITVSDCTVVGPDLSGTAMIFDCPPVAAYEISDGDDITFGHVQVRAGAGVATFSPHPLYRIVTGHATRAAAEEAFAALEDAYRPVRFSAVVMADDPVEQVETTVTTFVWAQGYGTLALDDGRLLEIVREDAGQFFGRISLAGPAGTVRVVSNLNADCAVDVSYSVEDAEIPVALPCSSHSVTPPYAGNYTGQGCYGSSDSTLTCLSVEDAQTVMLSTPGWQPVAVPLGADATLTDAAGLRPAVDLSQVLHLAEGSCGVAPPVVEFAGYCAGDTCAGEAVQIGAEQGLPDLADSGWTGATLPDRYRLRVVRDGAEQMQDFALDAGGQQSVMAYLQEQLRAGVYPLDVELENTQYALGRQVRFYSDDSCQVSLAGQYADLSNPGNRTPQIPQCSYFQVADRGQVRSSCTPTTFDEDSQRITAQLAPEPCGADRVVVMISEYATLNGVAGQAIIEGVRDLAQDLWQQEECVSIDIAHSIAEDRSILLAAEDIYFASDEDALDAPLRMDFVSRTTDVLRDFEWVYRIWGDDLSALVIVADGAQVRPANMIDSPAAMAWKLNNVMTQVITFDPAQNCTEFEQTLLFDGCVAGDPNNFEAQLTDAVEQAVQTIRGTQ